MDWHSFPIHGIALILGVALVYCGLFLYETEEKTIHNKLDDLWLSLDSKGRKALKGHSTLLQRLGVITNIGISRIYGDRLLSMRNALSTFCMSFLSISSFIVFFTIYTANQGLTTQYFFLHNIRQFCYSFTFIVLLIIPLLNVSNKQKRLLYGITFLVTVVYGYQISYEVFDFTKSSPYATDMTFQEYGILTVASFIVTQAILLLFPFLLRKGVEMMLIRTSPAKSYMPVVIVILVVGFIAYTVGNTFKIETDDYGHVYYTLIAHDDVDFAICLLGVYGVVWIFMVALLLSLTSMLSLHSAFWDTVKRPIYALARHKVFNNHKTLCLLGFAFLGYAMKLPHFVREIITAF